MQIKVYDKYIFKQVSIATLVCILLFTIVWIAPETMMRVIRRVLDGECTVFVGLQLLFFEIPKILNKALPIGLFLGSLFTFDKLSKDSEITIFRSVGLSSARIIAPVAVLSVIVTVLCFMVNNFVGPYSCNKLYELKNEKPASNFVYVIKDEVARPTQIIILPNYNMDFVINPYIMNFSQIHYTDVSELREIIIGTTGRIEKDKLIIDAGKKYSINEHGVFENIASIEHYSAIPTDEAIILNKIAGYKLKRDRDLTNQQLVQYMKLLKKADMQDEYKANFNKYLQRYFHSMMCILFAILGCYLGFTKPREQKLVGLIIAIGITFLYYITLPSIDVAAEKGFLPPVIAALFHPVILLFVIFFVKKAKDV